MRNSKLQRRLVIAIFVIIAILQVVGSTSFAEAVQCPGQQGACITGEPFLPNPYRF